MRFIENISAANRLFLTHTLGSKQEFSLIILKVPKKQAVIAGITA